MNLKFFSWPLNHKSSDYWKTGSRLQAWTAIDIYIFQDRNSHWENAGVWIMHKRDCPFKFIKPNKVNGRYKSLRKTRTTEINAFKILHAVCFWDLLASKKPSGALISFAQLLRWTNVPLQGFYEKYRLMRASTYDKDSF